MSAKRPLRDEPLSDERYIALVTPREEVFQQVFSNSKLERILAYKFLPSSLHFSSSPRSSAKSEQNSTSFVQRFEKRHISYFRLDIAFQKVIIVACAPQNMLAPNDQTLHRDTALSSGTKV